MLPSARLTGLAEKAVLVAVRKADPACDALRREFDARATSWVIVLDPRGELLDSRMADGTGALKNKETIDRFPDQFADRVEQGLQRKESLQDLERRWAKDPKEESGFEALAARLEDQSAYARVRDLCEKVAALPDLPADRRAGALLRGYAARPREYGVLGTPEADSKFVQDGERLIADHASHPLASRALEALFAGYSGKFDVPARSAAGIARLEAVARELKDPGPLRGRIEELSRLRGKEIETLETSRAAAKGNEASQAWYACALGDAETTIRVYSMPPYDKSAYYRRWVQEAREKLRKPGEK